ncbi:hypothetical protein [Halalkalicoccus subterraneus]|uniref:hypothetical protein n=1 Tax=Halalkalicoccus subterraneus TaxID=2675002 RepID=UPI001FE3B7DA|nr:hypothetical protein [Halalkalicoccus subterraneus]
MDGESRSVGEGRPPAESTDRSGSSIGRRRFVKALGVSGLGLASASRLSGREFEVASGGSVEIVYAYARTDPEDPMSLAPRTKTVDAEWYNELQAALSNYDAIDLSEISGVLEAALVPGDGDEGSSVAVGVTDEEVGDRLRALLDGVPVDGSVAEVTANEGGVDLEPVREFDLDSGVSVPGGVACGETEGLATLAPAIYDSADGQRFFATAGHLYADTDSTELTLVSAGKRVGIGRMAHRYRDEDLALIAPMGEFAPDNALAGGAPNRVVGQFTRLGLADLAARDAEIHKIGAMSGHTTGEIQAIDGVTCVYGDPCKRGQLKWGHEADFTDGDSGSVSFAPDPENPDEQVLVCGLNNARTWWPGEDYIWGTGAYRLQEEYGYTF